VIDRILQIIEYKGINKNVFYKETGLSNGFLDKVKDIGVSKLDLILKAYPEISMEWLVSGVGPMLKDAVGDYKHNLPLPGILNEPSESFYKKYVRSLEMNNELMLLEIERLKKQINL